MPGDDAARGGVIGAVADLMRALHARGIRVVAIADYSDALPGGGAL
jgi:hypothetical protein